MALNCIKKIGVTGGIGTGKTTVCNILRTFGCEIFSSDQVAKQLQETDQDVIEGLKHLFGSAIYSDGIPNRRKIADEIFHDSSKLQALHALLHPKVFIAFDEAVHKAKTLGKKIIAKEAAILFESGGHIGLDAVIVVAADIAKRMERLQSRGLTQTDILQRMSRQFTQEELIQRADIVIWNNFGLQELENQVSNAFDKICTLQK